MKNLLEKLNENQRKAVQYNGNLLVFAGAGSGKTRVITTKIAYAIQQGYYKPEEILAVTFTNKACDEMRERVASMLDKQIAEKVMIKTFHSFGVWFLKKFPIESGLQPSFQIYDPSDCKSLLQQCFPDEPKKEVSEIADCIATLKDKMEKPDAKIKPYYDEYQKRLRATNHIDFADMITRPIQALGNCPQTAEYMHGRFKMILVDEYQDSNKAQALLLRLICGKDTAVCVVGDDDQSIYRFRGAEVDNILNFRNSFSNVKTITLGTNYRCTEAILEAAKDIITNNRKRAEKVLDAYKKGGSVPACYGFDSDLAETEYVVSAIKDLDDYANTAIIYRNNSLSRLFEDRLMKARIPYHIVGHLSFYEREEIKDCLALISLCLNHRDTVAFKRMVNKPSRGIGNKTIQKILDSASGAGMDTIRALEQLASEEKGNKALSLGNFARLVNSHADPDSFKDNIEYVSSLLEESGIRNMYAQIDEKEDSNKSANLSQFVSSFDDPAFIKGKEGLDAFLENVALVKSVENDSDDGVTLITMHSTKGLEFRHVFIVGMENEIIPGPMQNPYDFMEDPAKYLDEKERMEAEERRLCYVAFTRAIEDLTITYSCSRHVWGSRQQHSRSVFLNEVQPDHLKKVESEGFYTDTYYGGYYD